LKTRGGYTLPMRWENSKVVSYSLTRSDGGKPKVFVNGGWKLP
jgi:hypothetical protein